MDGKEMENQQEGNNMMRILERMLQEQQAMLEVVAVVEWLVQRNMQFNRKEVSRYLRDYTAEMMWLGISEELQVTSFNLATTDGLQGSIHRYHKKIRHGRHLKMRCRRHTLSRTPPRKHREIQRLGRHTRQGAKVLDVLSTFESWFTRLYTRE